MKERIEAIAAKTGYNMENESGRKLAYRIAEEIIAVDPATAEIERLRAFIREHLPDAVDKLFEKGSSNDE